MDDILIALVVLVCFVLLVTGIDGEVKGILALAAGWVCGRSVSAVRK